MWDGCEKRRGKGYGVDGDGGGGGVVGRGVRAAKGPSDQRGDL